MLHPLTSTPLQLNGISIQRLWSTFYKQVWVFLYAQACICIPSNGTSVDSSYFSLPQQLEDSLKATVIVVVLFSQDEVGQSLQWSVQQQFELLQCYVKVWEPRRTRPKMACKPFLFGTDNDSQFVISDNHCLNLDSGEPASAGVDIQADSV
jgi:hypothetical protein